MDNIPLFGDRKNGRVEVDYPHPLLKGILEETYGVFVYQEQVMQAAQILAGYTLGGADLLRRAMGKKIQAEMDQQRAVFVAGCAEHNQIDAKKANELFDLIDKFAGYGFNKSHAAAYALLAYQTAWLKVHYPADFFAASMCYDISNTDALSVFVDDMRRSGVALLPPCINASLADFSVEKHEEADAVRYALGALKGVGEGAMEQLCAERAERGPFASLDEFADRINPRLLNRRQIESLAAGEHSIASIPTALACMRQPNCCWPWPPKRIGSRTSGQGGLFGGEEHKVVAVKLPSGAHWSLVDRMAAEKEAFGFYFSAHPVERYAQVAEAHGARSFAQICTMPMPADGGRAPGTMAVLVEDVKWRTSAKGRRYANAFVSDVSGQIVASCFDEGTARELKRLRAAISA